MKLAQPIKVWCLARDQKAHIQPVAEAFGAAAQFVYDTQWAPATLLKEKPDLVLCINDYPYDVARCLEAVRGRGIPSLILQDGILEWRCQYQNPLFGFGGGAPQHQPVLADKIACLGFASARHLAAWGNAAKVEVTGMPRLDHLLERQPRQRRQPGSRLLVMTAKNPGFTPEQSQLVLRSLRDVKRCLDAQPNLEVFWRVSRSVADALGVDNQLKQVASQELAEQVEQVDAVITTPSTAMLEAMLLDRPVAVLDYHNSPRFQPSAWTISGPDQVEPLLADLLNPPAAKMNFQQVCLADGLACSGPAARRVQQLMQKMIEFRRTSPECKAPFPENLLERPPSCHAISRPLLSSLYPNAGVFQIADLEHLQLQLARAQNENARLKAENQQLRDHNAFGFSLRSGLRRLIGAELKGR